MAWTEHPDPEFLAFLRIYIAVVGTVDPLAIAAAEWAARFRTDLARH